MSDELEPNASPEPPEPPQIDPALALQIVAERYGVTPEYLDGSVRLQEDNRRLAEATRRKEMELERKAQELEERARRYQDTPQDYYASADPALRPILDKFDRFEKRWEEERNQRMEQERRLETARATASELERGFRQVMRGVPSQNQVSQERFFEAVAELYPTETGELPRGISPERAVFATARYLGLNVNGAGGGYAGAQPNPMRDRRASIFIPGTAPSAAAQAQDDSETRRPGEPLEDYVKRLREKAAKLGISHAQAIPEGTRMTFE